TSFTSTGTGPALEREPALLLLDETKGGDAMHGCAPLFFA
ncbi:unnamed protein product, partial [marine sediment metagenome]